MSSSNSFSIDDQISNFIASVNKGTLGTGNVIPGVNSGLVGVFDGVLSQPQLDAFFSNNANFTDVVTFCNNLATTIRQATNNGHNIGGDYVEGQIIADYTSELNTQYNNLSIINDTAPGNQALNAFNYFLQHTNFNTSPPTGGQTYVSNFMKAWQTFMTQTAFVIPLGGSLNSYASVYTSFLGGLPNVQSFTNMINTFYQKVLSQTGVNNKANGLNEGGNPQPNGFFIPSQNMSAWIQTVQAAYTKSQGLGSSVVTSSSSKVGIINKVFELLVQMLGTIQNVGAAEANRLTFLSNWQTAYTQLQNQIHYISAGDTGSGGALMKDISKTPAHNTINSVNVNNGTYTTEIQGDNSIVNDAAKSLQANVNASNDAANQQATFLDGILQELTTILASIYK